MKTTNEFAFYKWADWAGDRLVAQYRIQDLQENPELKSHWFTKIHVAELRLEIFLGGLMMDFWNLFWEFK